MYLDLLLELSSIESGFSANKELISNNQSELSLRTVRNHLNAKNVTSKDIPITGNMLMSVRSARTRYDQAMKEAGTKKKKSAADLKRKIVNNELDEVKKKRFRLEESVVELIKDADKLAFEAA